jgi:hypothetical protein
LTELLPGGWTFTPTPNKPGSYRIQGIENEGKPSERRVERIFGVRTVSGVLIPAFGEGCNQLAHLENATATHIAQSSNNATDFSDPALNNLAWSGWWRMWHELALVAGAAPPGSAPTWIDDCSGEWGFPTNISLPTIDFTPNYGSATLTLNLAAHRRLDHASVECILLETPAAVSGGRALPTAEQADGVTLTTGQRCLARDVSGTVIGILVHDGAKLVEASDNVAARVAGHRVFAKHGRIFGHKTFRSRYGLSAFDWWVPLWICDDGPTRGTQKTVVASGSAGWVLLLSVSLAAENGVTHDVSLRACRWVTGTYASKRAYRAECTYFGDGTTVAAAPGMDPIVLHDVGEPDETSRMKATIVDGILFVWGYRDAAGGTSWDYRVEATVIDDLLSRAD